MKDLEDKLFDLRKQAEQIDHYRALDNKHRRELDRLSKDNGEFREEMDNLIDKKNQDIERMSKDIDILHMEKKIIIEEIENSKDHNKSNNILMEDYVMEIRENER